MRIGTVGTNFVVTTFIQAAKMIRSVEIAAVYSRYEEKAISFAEQHGVKKTYCDRAVFLGDQDLDFIYVASPNSLHYAWARDALLAGRNVICEKPFVSREGELAELITLSRKRGLFLFEALTVPHLPNYRLLKEHLGDIGTVRLVQLNFSQYSSRYDAYLQGATPNVFSPAFSGGALMDLNYYNLNFILGLWGEPEELSYIPNLAENGIDTSGVLILKYPGFVAVCTACKDSKSRNFVQIQGENGYILAPSVASSLEGGFTVYAKDDERHYDVQDNANVLYYELCDFAEAFQSRDRSVCDQRLEESRRAARLLDKARKGAGILFTADKGGPYED